MIHLRPAQQREAELTFDWAKQLVLARGEVVLPERPGHKVLRLDHLVITIDQSAESNTLTVALGDDTKMFAVWMPDNLPILFLDYFPEGFWRWAIKRNLDALNKRKTGNAC